MRIRVQMEFFQVFEWTSYTALCVDGHALAHFRTMLIVSQVKTLHACERSHVRCFVCVNRQHLHAVCTLSGENVLDNSNALLPSMDAVFVCRRLCMHA